MISTMTILNFSEKDIKIKTIKGLFANVFENNCLEQFSNVYLNKSLCQEIEANPNYDNHPRGGGGKQGDGLFFTNLNYAKIGDNYMQIYNKQNKHNCI